MQKESDVWLHQGHKMSWTAESNSEEDENIQTKKRKEEYKEGIETGIEARQRK